MLLENRRRVPRSRAPNYWVVELRQGWWVFETTKKLGFSCKADAKALAARALRQGKLVAEPRPIRPGEVHSVPDLYGSGCSYVEVH